MGGHPINIGEIKMSRYSNKEIFVEKAIKIHGIRFDYTYVVYVDSKTNINILCNKHKNIFTQTPRMHLTTLHGCPECIHEITNNQKLVFKNKTSKKFNKTEVIKIIEDTYGVGTFNYEKLNYKSNKTPFILICNKHKTDIKKTLRNFKLKSPYNYCIDCKKDLFTIEVQKKFEEKHGKLFDYSRCPSILGHDTPIEIKCPTHGWIQTNVGAHLRSDYGCNLCGNEVNFNFKKSEWTGIANQKNKIPTLYILKCSKDNEVFIKIGITLNDIKVRYKSKKDIPYNWSIIFSKAGKAEQIWDTEQLIKKKNYKKYKPQLFFEGYTECYDIAELDDIITYIEGDTLLTA